MRFGEIKKKLAQPGPWRWAVQALALGLIVAGVGVFYRLSIGWFKGEFSRVVAEQTEKKATRTSLDIANILSRTLTRGPLAQEESQGLARTLQEYINQNPNVVGVIVSDAFGRIVRMTILPHVPRGPTLRSLDQPGHTLAGYDAATIVGILTTEQPNLKAIRIQIDNPPVGWLTLLVDWTITTDAIDLAINRMTGRLTMLLGAMTMILGLAGLLVSRQRRMAQRLAEQRREVDRLAYVGTLAAGLAHEIRNPLNALAMQLELLEEDVGEGAPQLVAPRLQHIRKGLAGVERTVHDFLTYATPGRQQPRMIELATVVGTVCAEVAQTAPELQVRMESIVAPGLAAWCDAHALRQILSNLISNALRAQKKKDGPGHVRIEANRNGRWVDLLVDDAGGGVAAEQRERIFDCFYTTQSEGTGLGLPIARRLTEMNGGQLSFVPEPSPLGGARFRVRLSARPLALAFD